MSTVAGKMPQGAKPTHGLPGWLTASILMLFILLAVGSLWRYSQGNAELTVAQMASLSDTNVDGPPLPQPQRAGGPRRPRPGRAPNLAQLASQFGANLPDGIMPAGNAYLIKSGIVHLDIDHPNNRPNEWRFRFSYAVPNLATPDETATLAAARRAMADQALDQKLGITPQQVQQLKRIQWPGMLVTRSERQQIGTLFQAWLSASGRATAAATAAATAVGAAPANLPAPSPQSTAAQQALIAALADIGNRQLDPTRKDYAGHASQIQSILGDATLQKLKAGG